jgi:hypothetical protein
LSDRRPILRIEMTVKGHTTNELSDKADNYAVALKSDDGTLAVGMKEAKAKLSIKAEDDILHFNFPVNDKYVVEIYPKRRSAIPPQVHTEQTPLPEEDSVKNALTEEEPESDEPEDEEKEP